MSALILDGIQTSQKIQAGIKTAITLRQNKGLQRPSLAVIMVGDNPASKSYVARKIEACKQVDIISHVYHLPKTVTQETLEATIETCNHNAKINGILLQLPLPNPIHTDSILEKINPKKDVDGFHPYNLGRLVQRRPAFRPCTPYGIMKLLATTKEELAGKHAIIVGASNIVGRPMALELLLAKCTITVCHRFTRQLDQLIGKADILIAAIGSPGIIQSKWIKPGAIVIDVGFTRSHEKIKGDIDFDTAQKKASWITPVPGGVGPMTVAMLMKNTLQAAELSTN